MLWPQGLRRGLGAEFEATLDDAAAFEMKHWSFSQLCRLGGVSKETVNRLVVGLVAGRFACTSALEFMSVIATEEADPSVTNYTRHLPPAFITVEGEGGEL